MFEYFLQVRSTMNPAIIGLSCLSPVTATNWGFSMTLNQNPKNFSTSALRLKVLLFTFPQNASKFALLTMIVSWTPQLSPFDCFLPDQHYWSAPKVFWERLQYTATESQGQVAVCAKWRGTLRNEAQVRITATDITAIGKYNWCCCMKVIGGWN